MEIIDGKDTIFGEEVVQLKINKISNGLVVLETIFYNHDRSKTSKKEHDVKNLEEINLGTWEALKRRMLGGSYLLKLGRLWLIYKKI